MGKMKIITCCVCGSTLFSVNPKFTPKKFIIKCRKCNNYLIYGEKKDGITKKTKQPQRKTSSGVRIY